MRVKWSLVGGAVLASVGLVASQNPPSPEFNPHVILAPPEGTQKPGDVNLLLDPVQAKDQVLNTFFTLMDQNSDGALSQEELKGWVVHVELPPDHHASFPPPLLLEGEASSLPGHFDEGAPPPDGHHTIGGGDAGVGGGTYGVGGGSPMNVPPDCTDELCNNELLPQATNVACGVSQGNLLFRTVCNKAGFNSQAISLPAGRDANCFRIEAQTASKIVFTIYPEADPANVVYDTRRDGLHNFHMVSLQDAGVYRIELDMAESDPGARITMAFTDHPE